MCGSAPVYVAIPLADVYSNGYTKDLLALNSYQWERRLPWAAREVVTPLNFEAWNRLLSSHPDKCFVAYVLSGIQQGFRIGYGSGSSRNLRSAKKNMLSAIVHAGIIDKYL